ncbi:KilA-N domain-containing protein [Mariniflexile sp. AS56]
MSKQLIINVNNIPVSVYSNESDDDFISLTDMVKGMEGNGGNIDNWLRNKNTIEFLGVWEQLNNPNFNSLEFEGIMNNAGLNRFHLSVKQWNEKTNAIGLMSKTGRYGGTYAHKDIAFEFGAWISPIFKLYLIKEYQRLKKVENDTYNLEWDVKRVLSKVNYSIHTNAVQKHILPKSKLPESKRGIEYAKEADLLNLALFGCTAKEWRDANPNHAKNGRNIRDFASINELIVLSNLESMNAEMVKLDTPKPNRYHLLQNMSKDQLGQLKNIDMVKSVRRQNDKTYIEAQEKTGEELEQEISKNILDKNKQALSEFNKKNKNKGDD